jgi:hypothetical protein
MAGIFEKLKFGIFLPALGLLCFGNILLVRGQNPNRPDSIPGSKPQKMHAWSILEKGIILGYGYGVNGENLPEGIYSPLFFMGKVAIDFPKLNQNLNKHSRVALLFEPQINLVLLRDRGPNQLEYELGLGIGIQYRYLWTKNLSLFTNLIVGPQYFSAKTQRQTTGLIFSDNLGAGLTYTFNNHWALSGEFRIRHMSNANIVLPNYGINTNNFLLGISRFLR